MSDAAAAKETKFGLSTSCKPLSKLIVATNLLKMSTAVSRA
jgi:hypothetical protein